MTSFHKEGQFSQAAASALPPPGRQESRSLVSANTSLQIFCHFVLSRFFVCVCDSVWVYTCMEVQICIFDMTNTIRHLYTRLLSVFISCLVEKFVLCLLWFLVFF